ncbi:MAG: hypothetical protein J7497_09650 [Chitinophagaceae bacterium]|nr:hypothetical protein [Chitinophagaceae bacterium]
MKYIYFIMTFFLINKATGQNYLNVLNYNLNGTPVYGVKIKTNMPFSPANQMPAISIKGYNYDSSEPIDLKIVYYIYSGGANFNDPANFYILNSKVASSGGYTPRILLSNENGKVVIYIDDKSYYQRFTVSVFAQGMNEAASWFENWTAADEPLSGTKTAEIPYGNRFKGDVSLPGNGIWAGNGNVGIGTSSPIEKLSVNGNIRAKEIKVEAANWPDYVFTPGYKLPSLESVAQHIKEKGHLPDMPSAAAVSKEGIALGEMNKKLLEKVEELTLHLIEQNKIIQQQSRDIRILKEKTLKREL